MSYPHTYPHTYPQVYPQPNLSPVAVKAPTSGVDIRRHNLTHLQKEAKELSLSNTNGKIVKPVGVSTSINFGSIVGGEMDAGDIDRVIEGSSVGIQACHYACVGGIYTESKNKVVTYGLGTSQIGMSGGNMVRMSKLTEKPKERLFSLIELVAK